MLGSNFKVWLEQKTAKGRGDAEVFYSGEGLGSVQHSLPQTFEGHIVQQALQIRMHA